MLVLQIMGAIRLTVQHNKAILEWTQGLISDTIADSIIAILMSVDSAPVSVKKVVIHALMVMNMLHPYFLNLQKLIR